MRDGDPVMFVDSRTGSRHLLPALTRAGVRTVLRRLPFGDVAFRGKGMDDEPWTVGVELKHVAELLPPARDRFVGYQLPGLQEHYQVVVLLIEDMIRPNARTGFLEMPRGRGYRPVRLGLRPVSYREFDQFLLTLIWQGGVVVLWARGQTETVSRLMGLYRWWTKGLEAHRSLAGGYAPPAPPRTRPTVLAQMLQPLSGIGWTRAMAAAEYFDQKAESAVLADATTWAQVPGVGAITARRVWHALHPAADDVEERQPGHVQNGYDVTQTG